MEFLARVFDAEIDGDEDVVIGGESFARSRILRDLKRVAYDVAFEEWKDARRARMSEKAEEILALFDNRDRFVQLQRAHQARTVIPFIGAGMSIPSGYMGWTAFLRSMQRESHVASVDLESDLAVGNYEEAAQRLYDDSPSIFDEGLQNHFAVDRDIAGPVLWLPYVFTGCILTTNFDDVLKRVFDDAKRPFALDVCSDQSSLLPDWLNRGIRALMRMHGHCNRLPSRIITKSEYEAAYAGGRDAGLARDVLFARSVLFLGCSLARDRVLRAMEGVVGRKEDRGTRHFAFLELPDGDRTARRKQLANSGIHPVWYPRSSHDESIEALLMKLAGEI